MQNFSVLDNCRFIISTIFVNFSGVFEFSKKYCTKIVFFRQFLENDSETDGQVRKPEIQNRDTDRCNVRIFFTLDFAALQDQGRDQERKKQAAIGISR